MYQLDLTDASWNWKDGNIAHDISKSTYLNENIFVLKILSICYYSLGSPQWWIGIGFGKGFSPNIEQMVLWNNDNDHAGHVQTHGVITTNNENRGQVRGKHYWRHVHAEASEIPSKSIVGPILVETGGRFKNTYELLNVRALKFSPVNRIHIFQCMGKIFCVEFQRYPLKFRTKYLTHTLKDVIFIQH